MNSTPRAQEYGTQSSFPVRTIVRAVVDFGPTATLVAGTCHIIATAFIETESFFSSYDLIGKVLNLGSYFLASYLNPPTVSSELGVTALFIGGSILVTWKFWTPAVYIYVGQAVEKCRRPRARSILEDESPRCYQCSPMMALPSALLWYAAISCSIVTMGSVTNENEEGLRILYKLDRTTWITAIVSFGLGIVETTYAGYTELASLWPRTDEVVRRPTNFRYFIAFAGPTALAFRTWVVIFLYGQDIFENDVAAASAATFFTIFGTVQNFCFQAIYAIEGSPLVGKINTTLVGMSLPLKVGFLLANGVTTVVVNQSLSTLNLNTLLTAIVRERWGWGLSDKASFRIAVGVAAGITATDVLTSFFDGVVKITMGWEQPRPLFARGYRSASIIANSRIWNRSSPVYSGSQGRDYSAEAEEAGDIPLLLRGAPVLELAPPPTQTPTHQVVAVEDFDDEEDDDSLDFGPSLN